MRTDRWRYIRYADGSEELYDHANDPYEWTNLADNPEYAPIKQKLAAYLPKKNVPHKRAKGGRSGGAGKRKGRTRPAKKQTSAATHP